MVRVYITDVSKLPDPIEHTELLECLPDDRRRKIMRYRQVKDRKQCLGAGLLLAECLKEYHINIEEIRYGEHGKPEVEGIFFNLSHSGDMAVCAVSDKPVGCDIERIGEYKEGIAKRFFTEEENQYLERLEGDERKEAFYRLWTMKESYCKMTGEGMGLALDCIGLELGEEVYVWRDGRTCDCRIKEYEVPGYKFNVCALEKVFCKEINFDFLNGLYM